MKGLVVHNMHFVPASVRVSRDSLAPYVSSKMRNKYRCTLRISNYPNIGEYIKY